MRHGVVKYILWTMEAHFYRVQLQVACAQCIRAVLAVTDRRKFDSGFAPDYDMELAENFFLTWNSQTQTTSCRSSPSDDEDGELAAPPIALIQWRAYLQELFAAE